MLATVVRKPDVILVQNPPAVPTLLIAVIVTRLRGARLVVDWHNLGWAVRATDRASRAELALGISGLEHLPVAADVLSSPRPPASRIQLTGRSVRRPDLRVHREALEGATALVSANVQVGALTLIAGREPQAG
jgi:hypothetical protein